MRRYLIVIAILFASAASSAQQPVMNDSINYYLEKMDDTSIIIIYNYFLTLGMDADAQKLCLSTSQYVIKKLIENLNQQKKILLSHVLLSKNLELNPPKLAYTYYYSDDKIIATRYTYNNFSWIQWRNGSIEIHDEDVRKVNAYWNAKNTAQMIILRKCR